MPLPSPPFPEGQPSRFRATVHGTVFAGRDRFVEGLCDGDEVRLVADPPMKDEPGGLVHLDLSPDIAGWLWPWLIHGGVAKARLLRVRGDDVPSWRRLVLEVSCVSGSGA